MTDSLAHRGPNGFGVYAEGSVGLGHRRLSILDLSEAGRQPMFSDDGNLAITFNGEIYNYLEIKKELGGRAYRSSSDTEVILRAYEKWGGACLEKFNGIFAFAIWDKKNQRLFAARDRLGVKPFYYAIHENIFYFGSEIKALLTAGVPAKQNDEIIYDYLVFGFYDHRPETFFAGIQQLMPGHSLLIINNQLQITRYWSLPDRIRPIKKISDSKAAGNFLELVNDSSRLQLRSDVPVGMVVSGGLDSSLLAHSVHQILGGQKNFQLFHFQYVGQEYEQELPAVRDLAKTLSWQSPKITKISPGDMPALVEKIMWHEEQPFPGLPTVAWHKLYQELGESKTIVTLEGHGGDEMAAGYDYYFGPFLVDLLRSKKYAEAEKEIKGLAKIRGLDKEQLLKFVTNGLRAFQGGGVSADATSFVNLSCLNSEFLKKNLPFPNFEKPFDSLLSNFQYQELLHTKLPRVLRSVDRESMASGRELRVPLLDHRIVEFAFSLPLEQRIRGGQQRFFMRNAAKRFLPPSISDAPKRSLPNPQRAWFQKDLQPWLRKIITSKSFGSRKYFNQKKCLDEFENYCRTPNPINSFHIWQWISLELWHRAFID